MNHTFSQDDYDILSAYKYLVENRGIRDKEIAEYIGISTETALEWIAGKTPIGENNARSLCDYFNLPYKHFILLGRYINYHGHANGWPENDIYM